MEIEKVIKNGKDKIPCDTKGPEEQMRTFRSSNEESEDCSWEDSCGSDIDSSGQSENEEEFSSDNESDSEGDLE